MTSQEGPRESESQRLRGPERKSEELREQESTREGRAGVDAIYNLIKLQPLRVGSANKKGGSSSREFDLMLFVLRVSHCMCTLEGW